MSPVCHVARIIMKLHTSLEVITIGAFTNHALNIFQFSARTHLNVANQVKMLKNYRDKFDTCPACPCPKSDSFALFVWCCCVGFCTTQQVFGLSQSTVGFYILVLFNFLLKNLIFLNFLAEHSPGQGQVLERDPCEPNPCGDNTRCQAVFIR